MSKLAAGKEPNIELSIALPEKDDWSGGINWTVDSYSLGMVKVSAVASNKPRPVTLANQRERRHNAAFKSVMETLSGADSTSVTACCRSSVLINALSPAL
jgi:hypothetical protein